MNDSERLEEIESALDDLRAMAEDRIILIEGKKDRGALERLGIDAEVIEVQNCGGAVKAAEKVFSEGKKAIILSDWDERGGRIAADLREQLTALCIEYDSEIRARLALVCKKDIKDVEGLPALYCRLSAECVPKSHL